MFIKQISAFVENRPGRIAEITEILAEHEIDLLHPEQSQRKHRSQP